MSRMHNQYRELESSYNYIDKTECLEKEIERFPSVYIEGAAGCGKTTMMRMLLEKHPEVDYTVLWMDEDEKYEEYERYVDKYVDNSRWLILENVPEELPLHTVGMIKRSIRRLGGQDRIILIGRNEIPDALLGTFWNREMGLVTQNSMLLDQDEVECLIKQYGSRTSPEQLLRYTGGWAGIVDVILRLESKYGAWNPESCWHEMNRYIKEMILDTLQREEREILHLAQYLPWVDEEMCEEILGTAHAEVILGRMLRKGFLVHTEGEPDTRWSVAPIFCHIEEASFIGIEMCVRKKNTKSMGATDKDWYFEDATVEAAAELTRYLMNKYGVPASHVIRHYDVTGKICPNPYVYNTSAHTWDEFKRKISGQAETPQGGNEKTIWNFLTGKGLNAYAVAGIMGNLYAESGLMPNNLQNTYNNKLGKTDAEYTAAVDNGSYGNFVKDSAGYGLAQWTYWSRKQALLNHAKQAGVSIADLNMQLGFLWEELQGYTAVMDALKKAGSVRAASDAVLTGYEKPADQSETVKKKRAEYGEGYYKKYAAGNGTKYYRVRKSWTDAASQLGAFTSLENAKSACKAGYTVYDDNGKAVYTAAGQQTSAGVPFSVQVDILDLNIRTGAGTNYAKTGETTGKGVFTIVEVKAGQGASAGWGRLKSGAGWISLDYATRLA